MFQGTSQPRTAQIARIARASRAIRADGVPPGPLVPAGDVAACWAVRFPTAVWTALRGFGHTVNRKRVERLMRLNGIEGLRLRRRKRTTAPDRLASPAPDLVQRDFSDGEANEKWCGDITYVQVVGSRLYLAYVIDICSRRVLGYSMA